MTDNRLNLFCLVEGESPPFSVKASLHDTVDDLKSLIKTKKSPRFDGFAADELILWHVSILIDADGVPTPFDSTPEAKKRLKVEYVPEAKRLKWTTKISTASGTFDDDDVLTLFDCTPEAKKGLRVDPDSETKRLKVNCVLGARRLKVTTKLSTVFGTETPAEDMVHIIVQRPNPTPDKARGLVSSASQQSSHVVANKVYVVYRYVDYRKEVEIEIDRAYDNLADAIAYAETFCVSEGDEDDRPPEYVSVEEKEFDRIMLNGWGRLAITAADYHTRA